MLTIAWIRKELLQPQALGMFVMCSIVLFVTGCTLSFVTILSVLWIYAYVMYRVLTIPHKSQCHTAQQPKQSMAI